MMNKRTYILGAGFTKATANGPLMHELWDYIQKEYEVQLKRTVPKRDWLDIRKNDVDKLTEFIHYLESKAKKRFSHLEFDNISTDIRNNLEYLLTLIDIFLDGPKVSFEKKDSDVESYPLIPLPDIGKLGLQQIRSVFPTYFYLIFNKLEPNFLVDKFTEKLNNSDDIVTFNYDLILEKSLLKKELWSPLNGYRNVEDFEYENDKKILKIENKFSKIKIHKLHGSINWKTSMYRTDNQNKIYISMDDIENQDFHFNIDLKRQADKISSEVDIGYLGKHGPLFMLPSYVKVFKYKQLSQIWKSAIVKISKTNELIIIGYSFRPEDSNSALLISSLPNESVIKIVDPNSVEIISRLKNLGLDNTVVSYSSLKEYIGSYH